MKIIDKAISVVSKIKNENLEKRLRAKIKQTDFSIVCSNCIGGTIYNRLGLQFLSPTVNLWLWQYDIIKVFRNLKWYMEQDLAFIDDPDYSYPVAMLGDVKVHFNHSETAEDAARDWNRRKVRINYENLYFIMYEKDGLTREQLLDLASLNCKKIIVLTKSKANLDIPYLQYIEEDQHKRPNSQYFLDKDVYGIRTFEKQWNFVEWLNS